MTMGDFAEQRKWRRKKEDALRLFMQVTKEGDDIKTIRIYVCFKDFKFVLK